MIHSPFASAYSRRRALGENGRTTTSAQSHATTFRNLVGDLQQVDRHRPLEFCAHNIQGKEPAPEEDSMLGGPLKTIAICDCVMIALQSFSMLSPLLHNFH